MIKKSLKERKRSFDLSKLDSQEAVEEISKNISQKMAAIMDEANTKCNELLKIYGLQTKIHYQITEKK